MEDQSKLTFKQMLSALLRSNRRHARYIQAFACLAVLVAVAVPLVMRQYGVAMTTTETRLACQYAGNGAHTHNADCYDAYGNLVCPLPEKPFHTHSADCYATERVLTCTLPETAGHAHTEACYDEEGNLTCTLPEEPAHIHTDACYETRTTDQLICGMEETTEEHVHGPACFETVTVNVPDPEPETDPAAATPAEPEATVASTPEEDPTPAQEFTDVLKKKDENGNEYVYLVVQVKAPQGALPKGSTMSLAHVDLQKREVQDGPTIQDKLNEVLHKEAGEEAAFVQTDAVDITFKDAQGNRIDPAKKVEVRVTTSMIRTFSDQRTANDEAVINNSLLVLHVVDKQQTKRTDAPDAELIRKAVLVNQDEKDTSTGHEDTILFEATEFSPYIVARVNNAALAPEPEPEPEPEAQPAESEQPAAEATLDLTGEDQSAEADPERPAQSFTHRFTDTNGQVLMRVDVLAPEGAFPLGTTMQVKWVDASHIEESVTQAVSERTDGKLRDMRAVDITFIDADGHEIEPAKKITVTFASDLIDTQDDAYVVHVDDEGKSEVIDALGSKELEKREMADQADELVFESDAFSTYVVAVTTLHKELAASDGATYDITVDAPAEAGIPQDAELRVSEIVEGDEGYAEYLAQALDALGEDATAENTALARFFDIKIFSGEAEVQPQAPVKVSIQLSDAAPAATASAVHFEGDAEGPADILDITQDGTTTTFDATGFSVYGVIYTVDFHWSVDGRSYDYGIRGGDTLSLRELLLALNVINERSANEFISSISDVSFSAPELIAVAKIDEDTTSGALKEKLGVTTQYSAQLKADELAAMNAKALTAPDWALISLKAFDTTETLTITMNNGDQFVIKVTDAQLITHFISSKGEKYEVIVTYNQTAEIPEGAELLVTEITEDDGAYAEVKDKVDNSLEDVKEGIPSHPLLLDIAIMYEGREIEPAEGSAVTVEIKAEADLMKGLYTDDASPILINEEPVKDESSEMVKEVQVLHMTNDDKVDVMETEYEITDNEVVSTFTTDSFSNWLVFLDETLTDINLTTGDTLTLRPYTEWVWKKTDEPTAFQGGAWIFPSSDWESWTSWEGNVQYTFYRHKTNRTVFRSYTKTDTQLNETYTVVTVDPNNLQAGNFDIQTNKGKTIHVHVTQGGSSPKPATVTGVSGLTVNLFDYDVPYVNGQPDFTHSGNLDDKDNKATNVFDQTVNVGHNLDFLGWGADGDGHGVNSYTQDVPKQEIVKDQLTNGYPVLNDGSDQSLDYLFNTSSQNSSVYAFPNADGLFQQDNQGFYYYNSNVNYAEFNRDTNTFVLYDHTYSQITTGSNGANAKPIGFFPFHEYDTNNATPGSAGMNYNKALNHHFGMSLEVDFQIPKDRQAEGPDGQKHDIIYEFSGDDDLWVFVDDELVLDIGGLHQPVTGSINFTTGEIKVHGVNDETKTFKVGAHTMKMFYLERGGCDSNLSVKFNLPLVQGKAALDVAKKSLKDDEDKLLPGAMFGVWETPDCSGEPYITAISDAEGHVDFGYLPVTAAGQTYYLKEIAPPAGYQLNTTVFTATAVKDDENTYHFEIKDGDTPIERMEQEPFYPIIRDEKPKPIDMSVTKRWQNADGSDMANPELPAQFEVRRHVTKVKATAAETVTVILRNDNNTEFDRTTAMIGDVLTIHYRHSQDTWTAQCSSGNGIPNILAMPCNSGNPNDVYYTVNQAHSSNGTIEIVVPSGFSNWCDPQQHPGWGLELPHFTGSSGGGSSDPDIDVTTDFDENYSYILDLPYNGSWTNAATGLPTMESDGEYTYYYQYFIVEKTVPDGFEAVYLDGSGKPITDPSSQMTNHDGSQTVVNRKLLDVPIEKHWGDFAGDDITWTATFQLERMEVKVNEDDPDATDAITAFEDVEGKVLTIHKGQSPQPSFDDLPMYKVHSNGTVYRYIYSVEETAYEVKRGNDVVAAWSKTGGLVVGSRYTPQFEQDAGENGSNVDDYKIIVINSLENLIDKRGIELDIKKIWQDSSGIASDDNSYAKFVLKRLVHEEYRDYTKVPAGTEWVDITLDTWGDGTRLQTLHVPQGRTMHIVGSIKPETNCKKIVFSQTSGGGNLELVKDNTQSKDKFLFDITFTADQSKTVKLTEGDNFVVGGRDGFFLSDTYDGHTPDEVDPGYAVEFTLNKANGWDEYFDYLPTIVETDVDPNVTTQTIRVYSYYIEEVDSNPEGYVANFADSQGNLVDIHNAIDVSTEVTATNTGHFTNIEFGKDWKKPDGTEDETKATAQVTYTLFQISTDDSGAEVYHDLYLGTYRLPEDEDLQTATVDEPCSFTVTHTGKQTIYDLPTEGFVNGKHVTHKYYVLEEHIDGYTPDSPAAVDSGTYTITNTEVSPASETTDVTIEKKWEGTDAEAFGGIRVKLIQKRSELPKLPSSSLYDFYPVTISVREGDGPATTIVRYVKTGSQLEIAFTPKKGNQSGQIIYNAEKIKPQGGAVTKTTEVSGETTINIQLQKHYNWGTHWDYTIQTSDNVSDHAKNLIGQITDGFSYQTTDANIYINMPQKGTSTVDGNLYTTTPTPNAWKTTVNTLPYYEKGADGKYYVYAYEIAEASIIDPDTHEEVEAVTQNQDGTGGESAHFKVSYSTGVNGELVVTNTRKTDFQIIKVDSADMAGKSWRLDGALFELREIVPESESIEYVDPTAPPKLPETTGEDHKTGTDGVALFKDLEDGYYEIWEKEIPKHYLITENEKFYIKVKDYTVTLIERDAETGEWKTSRGNGLLVLAATQGTDPATATVGNIYGAELPQAGGPGTYLYTLCGLALFAAAGYIGFVSRRSSRKEVA